MSNVIAFQRPEVAVAPVVRTATPNSLTLFLHVKNATMIAHLGKPQTEQVSAKLGRFS